MNVGDEVQNEQAVTTIRLVLSDGEGLIAESGFDFETKVMAVTDQRVLIADKNDGIVLNLRHGNIAMIRGDGRTLIIRAKNGEEHRHKFGKDHTVRELVEIARRQKTANDRSATGATQPKSPSVDDGNRQTTRTLPKNGQQPHIAERVAFWEEQDRINQELIPRVIQQHEVLTGHIKNHENLQATAVKMVRETVEETESRINQQLEAAQEERRIAEQHLQQAIEERKVAEEQLQQASKERQTQAAQLEAIAEAKKQQQAELETAAAEREEMKKQHAGEVAVLAAQLEAIAEAKKQQQVEFETAAAEREEMKRQRAGEVAALKSHSRRMTITAAAAVTLASAAIVLIVLL